VSRTNNLLHITLHAFANQEVIVRFGTPYVIHTDQGVQFQSNLFQEMCRLLQIQKTRTTPYHPQSDGMVERDNRTILTMMSAFVNEHQNDWNEHLTYISMAYRAAQHETTGKTPNYMMLGPGLFLVIIFLLSVHGTFNIFPDMFMSFFHSVLEYPCPTILRDMCNVTWHAILNILWGCNLSSQHHIIRSDSRCC
jgi:transposase InsO family protein